MTSSLIRVAALDELHSDGPHALSANGVNVVLVRTPAGLRAFDGRCPHQGAPLGEGELDGDMIVCRNHRWRFSIDTGQREDGPECLASCPVVERERAVFVDVSGLSSGSVRIGPKLKLEDLPGPKGLPILGNLHQLDLTELHLILERWAAKYGPMYLFKMGSVRIVALSSPQWCEQVLRARPETFTRHSRTASVSSEMGIDGVFSAEGDAWRSQRRLAMLTLTQRHVRGIFPKIQMVAARLKKRWDELAETGAPLDFLDELKRFTVDVSTFVTFGHDVNTVEQEHDLIQRKLELVFPEANRRLFALFPIWRLVRRPRDRRLDNALAEIRAWLDELVVAERARLGAEPGRAEKASNFLEAMLTARDDEGRPFSDDVIFGNLMSMLIAGEDTTSSTLGWAIHQLLDNPESMEELRREADEILGASALAEDIETANKLAWAGAVADETMRLRPAAPIMMLDAKVETVVGDLLVPQGTRVCVLTRPAACDPEHFAEPLAFRPQRWLDEIPGGPNQSAYIPFGSGPRICPGRVLALLEIKVLLSMLYKNFNVERVGRAESVREYFAIMMSPAGLKVRLRRRSSGDKADGRFLFHGEPLNVAIDRGSDGRR